jgi:hypothetical protein
MKRLPRIILLLLAYAVGGAVINVAVAWGCAIRSVLGIVELGAVPSHDVTEIVKDYAPPYWTPLNQASRGMWYLDQNIASTPRTMKLRTLFVPNGEGRSFGVLEQHVSGIREYQNTSGSSILGDNRMEEVVRVRAGWPIASFETGGATSYTVPPALAPTSAWVLPPTNSGGYERWVPYKLLWPGFAINTMFYAAILWLLFAAPGIVRRRFRARRGQCPACAYPVGASDVCTECGRPVAANSKSPQVQSPITVGFQQRTTNS